MQIKTKGRVFQEKGLKKKQNNRSIPFYILKDFDTARIDGRQPDGRVSSGDFKQEKAQSTNGGFCSHLGEHGSRSAHSRILSFSSLSLISKRPLTSLVSRCRERPFQSKPKFPYSFNKII